MKKIILFLLCYCIFSFSAIADNKPYVGIKYQNLDIDRSTIDGYDLDNFAPTEFSVIDIYIGFNLNNNFFAELGYLQSEKETITGSQTVNSITITGTNISQELDGFRLGMGYKFKMNNNLSIVPFLNYYKMDVKSSGTFVASSGSASATASISGTESENWYEGGLGLSYMHKNLEFGISYSTSLKEMDEIDDVNVYSAKISYQF